ncbi:hypothetical protein LBMAG53_34390 [Planctomycetota bacterium]|nr:hypothetical protein LBMAG53_34390 [Planctomycetota bacterium]
MNERPESGISDPRRLLADLQTIMEVARALGSQRDLNALLPIIVNAVTKLVGSDRSSLFLVDIERRELWTPVAQGTATTIRLPFGKGIAGAVAADGGTINIPLAAADHRFDPAHDRRSGYKTRSILCMALRNHAGTVVGVLQTLNKEDGQPFNAYDEFVLAALCSQAAVAIDNAQLIKRDLERQRLLRDMELAREIQLSLLPGCPEPASGWRFAVHCRSCDQTGGDYYDFIHAPNGTIDAVIGDVSGHGLGAALFMGTARAFLRALHVAGTGVLPEPEALITRLNALLCADLGDERFMTMCLCRLGADGSASYVSAGHEPPLLWRNGAFEQPEESGLILGMVEDAEFAHHALPTLRPGDLLVLATDGIVEAQKPDGVQFGEERFRATVAAAASHGPYAVVRAVVAAVEAHLAGNEPHDDITLVVIARE